MTNPFAPEPTPARPSRWWGIGLLALALVVSLAWGIGWGLFATRRTTPAPGATVPVGQRWVDAHGTGFTVLQTRTLREMSRGEFSEPLKAPQGASYVLVRVRTDNWQKASSCGFELLGEGLRVWNTSFELPYAPYGKKPEFERCPTEKYPKSFTYWLSYLVPDAQLPHLVGLFRQTQLRYTKDPALAIPKP